MRLKDIAVLVPGKLNAHALERIRAEFECIEIDSGDPSLVTPQIAGKIRGIAAMTVISADLMRALPKLEKARKMQAGG